MTIVHARGVRRREEKFMTSCNREAGGSYSESYTSEAHFLTRLTNSVAQRRLKLSRRDLPPERKRRRVI